MNRIAVVVSLLLFACGGAATPAPVVPVPEPEPPFDPVALFPSDTAAVVRVDVERARRSPYYDTILGWAEQLGAAGEEQAALISVLTSLIDRIDRVHIAMIEPAAGEDEPTMLAVVEGQLDEGDLESTLRQMQEPANFAEWTTVQKHGRTVFENEDVSAVDAGDGIWLFAVGDGIDLMLSRLEGRGGSTPRSSDRFTAMAERVGFEEHTVAAVMEMTPRLRDAMRGEVPDDILSSLVAASVRLDVDDGIDAEAVAICNDANAAGNLTEIVESTASEMAGNLFVTMLGARPVLEAIETRVEDTSAIVSLNVDDATTRRVLARVSGLIMMAIAAFSEGSESQIGAPNEALRREDDGALQMDEAQDQAEP